MVGFEYKVIPAPAKGLKAPGIKGPEARFANALEHRINELAAEGWEYQRADILPSEERQGLTSSHTVYRSVLVFRRVVENEELDEVIAEANPADDKETLTSPEDQDESAPDEENTEAESTADTIEDEKKSD